MTRPSPNVIRIARELIRLSSDEWTSEQAETFLDQLDPSIRRHLILDLLSGVGYRRMSRIQGSKYNYKIEAIKLVRQTTGWGLKEAKEFTELAGGEITGAYIDGEYLTLAEFPAIISDAALDELRDKLPATGYQLS